MQAKGSPKKADDAKNLKQTRRRLSVMSDNKLIEGIDGVNLETQNDAPEVNFREKIVLIIFIDG